MGLYSDIPSKQNPLQNPKSQTPNPPPNHRIDLPSKSHKTVFILLLVVK